MDASNDPLNVRADERKTLAGFLDWQRLVTARKLEGLSREQATRVMTPTGLSALAVVKHLAEVERKWFRQVFRGEDVEAGVSTVGPTGARSFELAPDDTIESVLAAYHHEVEHSRRVVEETESLDELAALASQMGVVSLRWILVHMIEETARHNGHLDLMREAIDGRTGD